MRVELGWQYAVLAKNVYGLNVLTWVLDNVVMACPCLAMNELRLELGAATTKSAVSSAAKQSQSQSAALGRCDRVLNIMIVSQTQALPLGRRNGKEPGFLRRDPVAEF